MKRYLSLFVITILCTGIHIIGFDVAAAVPSIAVLPTGGPPGSSVAVTGSGFGHSTTISITFDSLFVDQASSDTSGAFTKTITIPTTATTGAHTIAANDGTSLANAPFTVTPAQPLITFTPTSGTTGTIVTISGSNFGASKTITIKFDNTNIVTNPTPVVSSSTGAFSGITITIPSTAATGSHTISATDGTSTPSGIFNVVASAVTLTPTSGATGTVVTVSGINFAASATITIKFDNTNIATNPTTVISSSTGSFSATITIPIAAIAGSHTITATDGIKTQSAIFTVVARSITLTPTSGIVGSTTTVKGTGFAPSASITIKFDTVLSSTNPSSIVADSSGAFSASVTIPSTAVGDHTISATDITGNTATATFSVIVSGTITLSSDNGNLGASITVTGSNFNPNSAITIKFDTTVLPTTPATITTTSSGTFTAAILIPLTATAGAHPITAIDASGRVGSATFSVAQGGTITLMPTNGVTGTEVKIVGSSFTANTQVQIKFGKITVATNPTALIAGNDGSVQGIFYTPVGITAGKYVVVATDAAGKIGTAVFTILGAISITLSPTSGPAGTTVTVSGSNFAPNTIVTITFDNNAVTSNPSSIATNSTGAFTATITIPSLPTGTHTVAIKVGTDTASATFTITQAQQALINISPTSGTVGTAVTVTGSSFTPHTAVIIKLDSSALTTNPASITTTSIGAFTVTITIPSVSAGTHTVTVTVGTDTASAAFSVTQGSITNKIGLSQMQLIDQSGAALSRPSLGMQVLIQSNLANSLLTDQPFAYIVQIRDSAGATVMISWMTGTIGANKQFSVAQSWLADDKGDYTAEVFVWQSISNPVILSPALKMNFTVQ